MVGKLNLKTISPLLKLSCLLLLTNCSGINALLDSATEGSSTPIVRASNGGQARLTLITCHRTGEGAQAVIDLINYLIQQSEIVIARSGGNASVIINTCPDPEVQMRFPPNAKQK